MPNELRDYIAGLPLATPAEVAGAGDAAIVIGGTLKRFTVNMFASRKTADLAPAQQVLGTEVFPSLIESSGLEQKIALREVHRKFTGVINPKMPPYNCKGDLKESKHIQMISGQNRVLCDENLFLPEDVGKLFYHSNAGSGFSKFESTITQYIGPGEVRTAANAGASTTNQGFWGTDDTAGMTQALADAAALGLWNYGGCVMLPPGVYLTGPLTYSSRVAIVGTGRRNAILARKPTNSTNALLKNVSDAVDFPILFNLGLYGMQYVQRNGYGSRGLEFLSFPGSELNYVPEVSPYPFFSHVAIFGMSWDGMYTDKSFSGDIVSVDLLNNWGRGWLNNCYDANVLNMLALGNWYAGVEFSEFGSANCNLNNLKASYNGVQGFDIHTACNVRIGGLGHNLTNCRLQETYGSNLVVVGSWNNFGDLSLDDSGCIKPAHGQGATYPTAIGNVRAGIHFAASTAVGNILADVKVGRSVHGTDYLTHAVFMSANASSNRGRVWTRPGTVYGNYLPGSGGYAPGDHGTDSSGGWGATNKIYIDEVLAA